MNILVLGGAGYIGSHMTKMLCQTGHHVVVYDNLSTGHLEAVKWGTLVRGDLNDDGTLQRLFDAHHLDAVMHFSAKSLVGESMTDPSLYYWNNVSGTLKLLDVMRHKGVRKLIFSSSAAVYGNPVSPLIDETHPLNPINPYGKTKLMVENILSDYAAAYNISSVSLRYFNAAGADESGEIGESHNPESHLIPNILRSVTSGAASLKVFGNDYPTPDCTCVRDYIHVTDLARAHLLALDYMDGAPGAHVFNLGNGRGFSILEVIRAAEQVIGTPVPFTYEPRRNGDPPSLVANSSRAAETLGWRAEKADITDIIGSAYKWHKNQWY